MTAPATATAVAQNLAKLARELDSTVQALELADRDATEKRAAYDLAFSRAFIGEVGAVDQRKHLAVIACERQRLDADVADALVRHLRRKVDSVKVRIDVGRTWASALKSEISLGNAGYEP